MFYADTMSPGFRMGDIVRGFVLSASKLSLPAATLPEYQVNVRNPPYAVILTPCCSIKEGIVALAPLAQINAQWLKNPYFESDLTNLNRPMAPEQAMPTGGWEKLTEDQRQKRLQAGAAYAFHHSFVFPAHSLLPIYTVRAQNTDVQMGHYATDFRAIHRVECQAIGGSAAPPINVKVLELTAAARSELRMKLAHYFGRVPDEDKA